MAIDKITPIRLDKSSDYKLVPKTSMVDALNMLITEDESDGGDVTTGNLGVLKNLKGNQVIEYVSGNGVGGENAKIIGSVTDTKLKIVYFFVWSNNINEHGVYAYDQLGKLPGVADSAGRIVRIHKSNLYNFPEHGFVKGNIVYTSQSRLNQNPGGPIKPGTEKDFEKDTILYFTDNTNEPRKINVYMAMSNVDNNYSLPDRIDFITACPKTPLTPIVFEFDSDQTRTTSNFKSGPGFQFAYQFISKDGVESAISPYSDIAFSPGIINQGGLTTVNHALHNRCVLGIPEAGAEIESIRILARQFNNPELVVLDEVSNTEGQENWVPNARAYFFYNDRIVRGVSTNEVNKQFDNLPRKAQAQSVVDNRLMYGNYLEGFNNVKIDPPCGDVVSFEERGVELIDLVVKLIPAISEQQWAYNVEYGSDSVDPNNLGVDEPQSDGARNKSAGYIIDCQEMPLDITTGDVFNVSVTISPNNNFHLYQATDSYHQSRHRGAFQQFTEYQVDYSMGPEDGSWDGGDFGGNTDDSNSWVNAEGEDNAFYGHQGLDRSGANWIKDRIPNPILEGEGMYIGGEYDSWGIPYSGNNHGVSGNTVMGVDGTGPDAPEWKTVLGGETGGIPKRVNFGTSAGNPLIIKGAPLTFSCKIKALANIEGDGRAALSSAISQALTGQAITWGGGGILETVEAETEVIYDLDLDEIDDGKQITEDNYLSKLIVGVVEDEIGGEEGGTIYKAPIGHFIVKKADVMFYLEKDEPFSAINPKFEMLRLCIGGMENVETYSVFKKKFYNSPWFAFSKDYLEDINPEAFFTDTSYGFSSASGAVHGTLFQYDEENTLADWDYIFDNITDQNNPDDLDVNNNFLATPVQIAGLETSFTGESLGDGTPYYTLLNNLAKLQEQRFLGYLDFDQNINQFFRFNKSQYESQPRLSGLKEIFPFSLVDGEGGMGGNLSHNLENGAGSVNLSSHPRRMDFVETLVDSAIAGSTQDQLIRTIRVAGPEFTGTINSRYIMTLDGLVSLNIPQLQPSRSFIPLMQGEPTLGLGTGSNLNDFPYSYYYSQGADWPFVIDFPQKHSYIEILNLAFLYLPGGGTAVFDQNSAADRTFKSNADHDFGIIYYDERGRHGFVNHLKTVYVPGYSAAERLGALHGRSIINLTLNHAPPKWAYYYKLAYTKNTSVQNFVQYSAGGAFVLPDNTGTANVSSTLIYVSLNYLQESSISYVAEWGARSPEGGLSMFKYIDGVNQKLRIISAYTDSENRDFFFNYEFDIVNIVLLGETDNPLGGDETEPEKLGEFVVLKNNPNADGFNYASVVDGSSKWDNNCIIELFTPARDRDEESRFYYEIGDTYNVNNPETDSATHSITDITLDKGDVWWRRVPVNLREYSSGDFQDLILDNTTLAESSSSSNFKPYYLETETASDLFKADATLIGRPNIILEDSIESIREASITYSGQSNPNSSKINYSSFNLTLSNFKDLQEEFGDINYMCNMEGDVFVIQSDRCTLVPASKTLFSDVSGTDTVAASKSPLGQERVFAGRAGCDNNPESVVQVGAFVYFAHKNLGKVYRFNPSSGVKEISDQGMASYFRGVFKAAINKSKDIGDFINYDDVRVVGGFDPVNEEYLLTVLDPLTYGVIPSGGAGEFGGNEGDDSASSITVNSLEQQVRNILEAILTTTKEDANGVETLAFDINDLPQVLQDFYNDPDETLDPNEDGVFNADEVVGVTEITSALQTGVQNLAAEISEALSNNDLQLIHDAISDSAVPETVEGVVAYIDNLELPDADALSFQTHINSIIQKVFNLMNMLSNNKQSYSNFNFEEDGQDVLLSSQSPSEFMSLFGNEGRFPFEDLLQNAADVSMVLMQVQQIFGGSDSIGLESNTRTIYSQGEVWGGPSLNATADLQIDGDFFDAFKQNLGAIMVASQSETYSTLDIAQEFIANSYISAIGTEANLNITADQVPTAIVNSLNQTFGTSLTIDDIDGVLTPYLINQIEQAYISGNGNYNADFPDFNVGILQQANSDLYDEIIDNYLIYNPQLNAGLQDIIDTNNLTDQAGLNSYVQGLIFNVTQLNNFIEARVGNMPTEATQAERLTALAQYIQGIIQGGVLSANVEDEVNLLATSLGLSSWVELEAYINNLAANQGEGYSSLETALAGEGISISQLRNLIQQITISAGADTTTVMSDLNADGAIGTADLILFLTTFGTSTNIDYSVGYTGLNLPN